MLQTRDLGLASASRMLRCTLLAAGVALTLSACSTVGPATQGQQEAQEYPKIGELPRDKPDRLLTPAEKDKEIESLLKKKKAQGT